MEDLRWVGMLVLGGIGALFFLCVVIAVLKVWAERKEEKRKAVEAAWSKEALATTRNLYSLSPYEFEEYVGILFERGGYAVEQVGGSGDGGIDLWIARDGYRAAVQCKRYTPKEGKVGAPQVRNLLGAMVKEQVQAGYLVTTGKFTSVARAEAQALEERYVIRLIDGEQLSKMARKVGLPGHVMRF